MSKGKQKYNHETKEFNMKKILVIASVMLLGFVGANAAGTTAGTDITNSASLTYTAGGVTQTAVNSNTDTFKVDRKIDVIIAVNNSPLTTTPGAVQAELIFEVANQGNDGEIWQFSLTDNAGDDFDVDTVADCHLFDGATDLGVFTQNVAFTKDQNKTLSVKCDIPLTATNGQNAEVFLTATIQSRPDNSADADNPAVVQNVYAEALSDNANAAHNGTYTKGGTYHIEAPVVDLTKLSCVLEDPVNGVNANAKRIPGATVIYMFDVNNTGATAASAITIADAIDVTNLDYGTIANVKIQTNKGSACACVNGTPAAGTAGLNSGATPNVVITPATVSAGNHTCISFEVDIK